MIRFKTIILVLLLSSCKKPLNDSIVLTNERDLFPEGIATNGHYMYISSIAKNKIVQYDLHSQETIDFIQSNQYSFSAGIGLFLKDSLLFALTNDTHPSLFVFNSNKHSLMKTYQFSDNQHHLWNDLVVSRNNIIYITDTEQGKIFRIQYPSDSIEVFLEGSLNIKSPNGITISDDEKKLFIASTTNGLQIVDLKEKKVTNPRNSATKGIDGMKYFNNSIYAVVNSSRNVEEHRLIQIKLTNDNESISKVDTLLIRHHLLNVPTTIDIANNIIYVLANSQIDNLDQHEMKAIDKRILTNTYIIRLKIKNGG